ncbi:DUF4062 domain-containing protein [Verrucomicrobium sp. BvORR106]|uniref:DUF4062 domain-containing protein n=1 Tax=Verrucomicrobium sp. BvORR106 TaxID=1403819 RepID=UPI0005705520|nr:DUF4062 domain-containing protein [Verrucomicrobium sp. BvORR106]
MNSVFISATTKGFAELRKQIAMILKHQRIEVLEQEHFTPASKIVQREIEEQISRADGVLFLVGPYYGYPMQDVQPDLARRHSYTQYEWHLAKRWGKRSLTYLIEDKFFPSVESEPEPGREGRFPDEGKFTEWQRSFWDEVRAGSKSSARVTVSSELQLAYELAKVNWREWLNG